MPLHHQMYDLGHKYVSAGAFVRQKLEHMVVGFADCNTPNPTLIIIPLHDLSASNLLVALNSDLLDSTEPM